MDEVRQDQGLLKGELHKAQSVVEAMNAASPRSGLRKFQLQQQQQPLNRPRHLHISGEINEQHWSIIVKDVYGFHFPTPTHTHAPTPTPTRTITLSLSHTYTHTHTHTYTHTHTHTHIHTHTENETSLGLSKQIQNYLTRLVIFAVE